MSDSTGSSLASKMKFEPWVLDNICLPIVVRLPRKLHPNTISIANHAVAWAVFGCLAIAPQLSPGYGMLARVWGGVLVLITMVLDCLDGMHARRTGQTSRTGAVLDHWFDAINVPLAAAALCLTLQIDPITLVASMALTAAVYGAQTMVYYRTGKFEEPPTAGTEAQTIMGFAVILFGIGLYFFPLELRGVALFVLAFVWASNVLQVQTLAFFWQRISDMKLRLLAFVGLILVFGALHIGGLISALACGLGIALLTFRIAGNYVLYGVLGRPFGGWDWGLVVWIAAIAASNYLFAPVHFRGGYTLQTLIPYLGLFYIVTINVFDFARHLPELRDEKAATDSLFVA